MFLCSEIVDRLIQKEKINGALVIAVPSGKYRYTPKAGICFEGAMECYLTCGMLNVRRGHPQGNPWGLPMGGGSHERGNSWRAIHGRKTHGRDPCRRYPWEEKINGALVIAVPSGKYRYTPKAGICFEGAMECYLTCGMLNVRRGHPQGNPWGLPMGGGSHERGNSWRAIHGRKTHGRDPCRRYPWEGEPIKGVLDNLESPGILF